MEGVIEMIKSCGCCKYASATYLYTNDFAMIVDCDLLKITTPEFNGCECFELLKWFEE